MLIGICGAAGSGKDEVATVLVEKFGYIRNKFADPLYEMVAAMTGYTVSQLQDRRLKEKPIGWLDSKTPRQLLQTLGTDWGRTMVHSEVWIRSVQRRVERALEDGRYSVITDLRFDNEAEWVRNNGGVVWRVERDVPGDVACLSPHASEQGVRDELVDTVIANTGTLEQLRSHVAEVCGRLL
jgi:cytidylate kinase